MEQPLSGVRVVDLSRVLAGPYCTMMLGDLGADIIKIEVPGSGDDTRQLGPPFVGGESAYYLCVNRNKRSVTLNLKAEQGKEILRDLVRRSDVLLENFRLGTMERLGVGYEDLRQINPGLVYCAITGYGCEGPDCDVPGYDFTLQARGGIMSITGDADGEPMRVGVPIVDITAGMFAASAILAALRARDRLGKGQRVDISLLETELAWLTNVASNYLVSGEVPASYGNAHPNIVPYQTFRTRDRYIAIAVGNDRLWQRFCKAIGREELATDARFLTNADRVTNRAELVAILAAMFTEHEADLWLAWLKKAEIPCAPINTLDKVFTDPQVECLGIVREIEHPTAGTVKLVGPPYHFSETPAAVRQSPPLLGEHTAQVLAEVLGYTPAQVAQLREKGVV